ncbi:MAG: glycosyltransferase [Bacteroidales bacterium]|nr:glycosyltransferase [Bacteroidales bacterium]
MKIFVLLPRFPYPLEKGDKLRAFYQVRHMAGNNKVYLFAISDIDVKPEHIDAVRPYCESITIFRISLLSRIINVLRAFFKGLPLQAGYFFNPRAAKMIRKTIREVNPDHIYCQLIRVAGYVENQPVPKTLDYQDVFSKGVERRIKNAPFYLKPVLTMEYRRLIKYERRMFDVFDHKTIISKPDRDLIPHPRRSEIMIIENGVNTDFFKPLSTEKEYDVVFTGNMGYPPNIDAAVFLAESIFPLVLESRPETTLVIAGAAPHPRVKALASENVKVTGWVDDIRECYAKAGIFIAPMRIGTGLQNKLLEAMAMKVPCITTSLANKALEARNGEELLVGDTARELAGHILFLLQNPIMAEQIAIKGFAFVHEKYNWEKATERLVSLMNSTVNGSVNDR